MHILSIYTRTVYPSRDGPSSHPHSLFSYVIITIIISITFQFSHESGPPIFLIDPSYWSKIKLVDGNLLIPSN